MLALSQNFLCCITAVWCCLTAPLAFASVAPWCQMQCWNIYIWSKRRGGLESVHKVEFSIGTVFEVHVLWEGGGVKRGTFCVSQPLCLAPIWERRIQRQRQERLLYLQLTLVGQAHLLKQLVSVITESRGLDATSGLTSVPLTFVTQCNLSERVSFILLSEKVKQVHGGLSTRA